MAVHVALATMGTSLVHWGPLFAREPEPDPDLDEIPPSSMDRGRSSLPPPPPPRRSSRKPLVLLLLLVIIAGGTYLYMEPDALRGVLPESVMDLLGEGPTPSAPQSAEQGPNAPPPSQTPSSLPAAPGEPSPATGADAMPPVVPPPGMPPRDLPSPGTASSPPATASIPEPRYGEGQLVAIRRNPAAPNQSVALTADAAGTKPGPVVRAGTMVRVLDGDLQGTVWVYAVKTPEGAKGWLAEERLQAAQP